MIATKTIATTLLSGIVLTHGAVGAQAADTTAKLTMKPLHGISFDVGARRAVSYYQNSNGRCALVLTIAEAPNWDNPARFTSTRFEATLPAGETARYKSDEGKAIDFSCEEAAQTMSVDQIEQIATGTVR
jgi:hypothetical protein